MSNDLPMGIPSVDLAQFLNGTAEEKQQFVNALGQAYEEIGFVAVKNPLIADDTIANLYQRTNEEQFIATLGA